MNAAFKFLMRRMAKNAARFRSPDKLFLKKSASTNAQKEKAETLRNF
jgi:hypothetical protein